MIQFPVAPSSLSGFSQSGKTCPRCQQGLTGVGIDFRAPKKTDVRGWARSERIYQELQRKGLTFSYCTNHSKRSADRNRLIAEEWKETFRDSRNRTIEEEQRLLYADLMKELCLKSLSPPNGALYKEAALSFETALVEYLRPRPECKSSLPSPNQPARYRYVFQ